MAPGRHRDDIRCPPAAVVIERLPVVGYGPISFEAALTRPPSPYRAVLIKGRLTKIHTTGPRPSAERSARDRRDATACQYLVLTPHYLEADGRANVHSNVDVAEGLDGALHNEPRASRRRRGRPKRHSRADTSSYRGSSSSPEATTVAATRSQYDAGA